MNSKNPDHQYITNVEARVRLQDAITARAEALAAPEIDGLDDAADAKLQALVAAVFAAAEANASALNPA